jgi:STE24 endopeptidase
MTRLAVVPAAVLLCVGSVVAAYLLWRSSGTGAPPLHHLDPHAYFTAGQLRAARSFSRVDDVLWWAATAAELAVFALFARYGARWTRESAAGPIGTGMLLGMLGFALLWLVELPFGVMGLWWQRHHHLSHVGYLGYVFGGWLALGGEFVFLCLALAIVMGFARLLGRRWWLAAAPAFTALAALSAFVSPYLLQTHGLHDRALAAAASRLERREGVSHVPVVVENVRDITTLPNAEAMGIGPSRRIVVWNTLLDGRFSPAELRVVIAHEIGHLAHNDIWRQIGWFALFAVAGTFLIELATRGRGGIGRPEVIPFSLFVLVVLQLVALPIQNAISRRIEADADWAALNATHDPGAANSLFRAFVPTTLDDPTASLADYLLLEDHPTVMQRLEMVRAWREHARR